MLCPGNMTLFINKRFSSIDFLSLEIQHTTEKIPFNLFLINEGAEIGRFNKKKKYRIFKIHIL